MGVVIKRWVLLVGVAVRTGGTYIDFFILFIPTPLVLALFTATFILLCSVFHCLYYKMQAL